MKIPSIAVYQDNRAKFPLDDLQKYDDRWVAFSTDGIAILADGKDIAELDSKLSEAGMDLADLMIEHIVFEKNESYLGGAEFN